MFNKILVADRGSSAVRIIRACRAMGIRTVAVYSVEDSASLHVKLANQRVCIGEGPEQFNYHNINTLIQAAINMGADAIHPGCGFMAENPEFARSCSRMGIRFIGPESAVIDSLRKKPELRLRIKEAGIPVLPGIDYPVNDPQDALMKAREIGFPVIIKAASGGGNSTRVASSPKDFDYIFDIAQRESANVFGEDAMYVEKFIPECHHVSVQMLCDSFGNIVSLGDRESSVGYKHRKLLVEAPSPAISPETRAAIIDCASSAVKISGCIGAATVDFLVDRDGNYYYIGILAGLQPGNEVTEQYSGTDIVEYQIRIAAGENISGLSDSVVLRGHAMECIIGAEISEKGFMPSTGKIGNIHLPGGNNVRTEIGIYTGYSMPSEYDSLIGTVTVGAADRNSALQKMKTAIDETVIMGVETSLDFFYRVLINPEFVNCAATTSFVADEMKIK